MTHQRTRILANLEPEDFVGRANETEMLARRLSRSGPSPLAVLSTPHSGASELLRQIYDRLFLFQDDLVPFYFNVKRSDRTALDCARRFARELATQAVAFRRHDHNLHASGISTDELFMLAYDIDAAWIGRIAEQLESNEGDCTNLISSPIRAAMSGVRILPIIDDVHELKRVDDGDAFLAIVVEMLDRLDSPSIVCGRRRYLFARTPFERRYVDRLSSFHLAQFVDAAAMRYGIRLPEQTRDLIAVQLAGNVHHVEAVLARAAEKGIAVDRFRDFEKLYTDELCGGTISLMLDDELADGDASSELNPDENRVCADYLDIKRALSDAEFPRAQVVGEATQEFTRRAPVLMARHYRKSNAIGLKGLMEKFDGREVPRELLDYSAFKETLKGRRDEEVANLITVHDSTVPTMAFATDAEYFYPQIGEIIETERAAVGLGFENGEKVTWIAAEIDSKLEADAKTADFWCDRLEMLGTATEFKNFRIWLVAPEGFDEQALDLLKTRKAFGSSRRQVEMLWDLFGREGNTEQALETYELAIPMGDDTEIIAAHALADIARRHAFDPKSITQMKTAVVEACINAAEHSLSPDRRINLKFAFADVRATITISNRGLRLSDKLAAAGTSDAPRRGWGLKLIQSLMDDVWMDEADDGTVLTMTKTAKA